MLKIPDKKRSNPTENTIALINVVFLMLIFFLVAGTLIPPIDKELSPISTSNQESAELSNLLSIRADGALSYNGKPTTIEAFMAAYSESNKIDDDAIRVFPDKSVQATTLVDVLNQLKNAGAKNIFIVTKRKLEN